MLFRHLKVVTILAAMLYLPGTILAETLHLSEGTDWKSVSEDSTGRFLLDIANIKQLINDGKTKETEKALIKLKSDFPEVLGADFDTFMSAEMLYGEGKWVKAVVEYNELLDNYPDSWLNESSLERQYAVGVAFLAGQKRKVLKVLKLSGYDESVKIMQKIADRVGDAPIAKRALVALAKGQAGQRKYLDAYETWADISVRWPGGEMGRISLLEMAQSLHSAYNGPNYDHTALLGARTYYSTYKAKYSHLAVEHKIDEQIALIDEQIAFKNFNVGEHYARTNNYEAADLYYNKVKTNWSESTAAKMADMKLVEIADPEWMDKRPKSFRRKMFEGSCVVLDNWYGLAKLVDMPGDE